jgi:gamma-glutamyl-gamma-aminobutyrate hydrolase PuuD
MKPMIGITTYLERTQWGAWDCDAALVPASYVRSVERAGARALLVPPSTDGVDEVLDALHGVVLSGGADLDPQSYGADAHVATTAIRPDRDAAELALLRGALDRDMPTLAICRGSQIFNVLRGGDLVQHLPEVVGHEQHREVPGVFSEHDVAVAPGSRLGSLLGTRTEVKSHHHQGYGRIGEGLRVVAWADDGTLEALEDPERRFALGVLWHPEEDNDAPLFEALVEEARRYRAERA